MSLNLQNSRCQLTPEESSKPSSIWQRLSFLERRLSMVVVMMILFSTVLLVAIILLAISGGMWGPGQRKHELCTTKECVQAASLLIDIMNETVDPCVDFFAFTCGRWNQKHPIPPDRTRFGTFDYLRREVKRNIKNILERPEKDSEPEAVLKAKKMFRACYNETVVETLGLNPVKELLANNSGWPMAEDNWKVSKYDWMQVLARFRQYGFSYLISIYVHVDTKRTNRSRLYVDQSGTGLGRIYLMNETKYSKHVQSYRRLIYRTAKLFGAKNEKQLNKDIDDLVEFETRLAEILTPPEQRRNRTRMYNNMTLESLYNHTKNELDWLNYLNTAFEDVVTFNKSEELIVVEPDHLTNLLKILSKRDYNRTLANYIGWRIVRDMAWHLNYDIRSLVFDYSKNVSGLTSQEPRWRSCAGLVNSVMGIAVGHPYVKDFFKEKSKIEANMMISHIRRAFFELIETNDWMDTETKLKAKEKAAAMRQFIGYPEAVLNITELNQYYKKLIVSDSNHFDNMMMTGRVDTIKEFEELRRSVNKNRWVSQPGVVNAFYSPTANSITFPAGILQPPFFSAGRIAAMNYGAIGTVIGHEITHGFDDKGRQMDKDGNLKEWWPKEVVERYIKRADCIRKQYSNYCPEELKHNNQCLNGNSTLGENIADNGGLKEAFLAYKNYVRQNGPEPRLPGLENYSPEQLFFLSFGTVWCSTFRPAALENQILYGSHSPGRYRVWGTVSNSEDFAKTFKCGPNTPMNRGKDRCTLW